MATALSVFSTNTDATTITTARKLVTATGAASTNAFDTKCGTSTGYSEIFSQGTTNNWAAAGSIGAPSGNGFLLEDTILEGKQIVPGDWTPRFRGKVSVGTVDCDIYIRAYIYDAGTYTQIGSTMSLTGQTLTTTSTNFTFAAANQPASATFPTGGKLYVDCFIDINTNSTGSASATISVVEAISSTQGHSTSFKIDPTPGYATPTTKDLSLRARVQSGATTSTRDLALRARLADPVYRDLVMRSRLLESNSLGQDNFTRPNQSGFGVATDGQTWTYLSGTEIATITSNAGRVTSSTGTATFLLGLRTARDVDILIRAKSTADEDHFGLVARLQDANTHYRIFWSDDQLRLIRDLADVKTTLATGAFTINGVAHDNYYWIRAQIFGGSSTTVRAKIWLDGDPEPGSWTASTTDTNPLNFSGRHGLHLSCNLSTNIVEVNSYTAVDLTRLRDLAMRARISNTRMYDLSMLARVQIQQFPASLDLALRARLAGLGQHNLAMRAYIANAAITPPVLPPASFTTTIADEAMSIKVGSLSIEETTDGRSTCKLTIEDALGTYHVAHRNPVEIEHNNRGVIFRGFVNDGDEKNLVPNPNNEIDLTNIDEHWLADKRVYDGSDFASENAGTIAAQLALILVEEGVESTFAVDRDSSVEDWEEGTLSNLTTQETGGTGQDNGALVLAAAGTARSITETFIAGSEVTGNTSFRVEIPNPATGREAGDYLTIKSSWAMKITGECTVPGGGDLYTYHDFWRGSRSVAAGDALEYDVWIASSSPEAKIAIDLICSDGTTLRDAGEVGAGTDAQGLVPDPSTDLKGVATDQWYHRRIGMSLGGKTIVAVTIGIEGDNTGTYTAYFKNVHLINSSDTVLFDFFPDNFLSSPKSKTIANNGYANVALSRALVYEKDGIYYPFAYSTTQVGIARNSLISWQATIPEKFTLVVETSLDLGATWQTCTNFGSIPNLIAGTALASRAVLPRFTLTNTGDDPTQTVKLHTWGLTVSPSFVGTKQDNISITTTSDSFGQGTLTSLLVQNNILTLNQFTRNWDDTLYQDQGLYGLGSPYAFILKGTLGLKTDASTEAHTRMDAAGMWQDFIAEIDINIGDVTGNAGLIYRTNNGWQNNDNAFAYIAIVSTTAITLGRGTNSASGAGSFTQIATASLTLSSGNWHRLRVEVTGNMHTVFLDNAQYLQSTDSTYTGAGSLGLRFVNSSGARASTYFDNFGVVVNLSGTRVSDPIDLSSVEICQDSYVAWGSSVPGNSEVSVESSIDGGATWSTCTNGGTIPGLTRDVALADVSLQTRATLSTPNAAVAPTLTDLTTAVIGQLEATGERVSPPLSLDHIGRVGSSLISFRAVLPTDETKLGVDVSFDAQNWTNVSEENGQAIALIASQSDPYFDTFIEDISTEYTQSFLTSGVAATWSRDHANSRLIGSGGIEAVYLYNEIDDFADGEIYVDSDFCTQGGIIFCYNSAEDSCYQVALSDDAASPTGRLFLYRVMTGSKTQLGNTILIDFDNGQPTRFKVVIVGGTIAIFVDGREILTYTDTSPLTAGLVGLRSSGGTNRYTQLRIMKYGDDVSDKAIYTRLRLATTDPLFTPQVEQLTVSVYGPNIDPGVLVPETTYSILNGSDNSIAQDLDDLAQQSDYWWRIKQSVLYFQRRDGIPSPWIAVGNRDMLHGRGVSVTRTCDLYRNEQIINGAKELEERVDHRFGDGFRQSFDTGDPINSITSITVNGQEVSFGLQGVDTDREWYFQAGQKGIVQSQDATPLASGREIIITYQGIINIVVKARREGQIIQLSLQDGTSGVITAVEKADGLTRDAAIQLAISRLEQYAKLSTDLEFTTLRPGLEAGQFLTVFLPQHDLYDETFLITSVSYTPVPAKKNGQNDLLEYFDVKATNGADIGSWEHLFS